MRKKQTAQALALEQALLGTAPERCELEGPNKNKQECIIDEQLIIATTGLTNGNLAGDIQGGGPGNGDNTGVILPCTGDPQTCVVIVLVVVVVMATVVLPPSYQDPRTLTWVGCLHHLINFLLNFLTLGLVVGGSPAPPPNGQPTNIQTGESLWPPNGMPGGEGLLTFIKGEFYTADKELLLADSGSPGCSLLI